MVIVKVIIVLFDILLKYTLYFAKKILYKIKIRNFEIKIFIKVILFCDVFLFSIF